MLHLLIKTPLAVAEWASKRQDIAELALCLYQIHFSDKDRLPVGGDVLPVGAGAGIEQYRDLAGTDKAAKADWTRSKFD